MRVVIILRSTRSPVAVGVLMFAIAACGTGYGGVDWPVPPRTEPVGSAVTISRDGRVITAEAMKICGHRPLLIARSYAHKVTLRLVNPDRSCRARPIPRIAVSVALPSPLGKRHLVQALTGKPIRYRVSRS